MFAVNRRIRYFAGSVLAMSLAASAVIAASPPSDLTSDAQAQLARMTPQESQMMLAYTPELRRRLLALSPQVRATLGELHATHKRHSKELTLRQVMQELLSEFQGVAAAIATDNAEQAADSARRLADHRIPVGGLLPYFPLDKITDEYLATLPAMNYIVEGSALKLAEAADRGSMPETAVALGQIASGCVACHQVFRGRPGVSPLLLPASKSLP
jgi:mono/diheme cytochrome c family protein